jgi:hypothetical protein
VIGHVAEGIQPAVLHGACPAGVVNLQPGPRFQAHGLQADVVSQRPPAGGEQHLMPDRRLRVCPRIVKRAISKYQARGSNIDRTSYKATTNINILAPPKVLTATTNP